MALPGRISFCQLEEDNPQKSYFRIRPLLTVEDGRLAKVDDALELYGDEGGIRIVPDKNEAMRFKNRMRTLGGYCLLDLLRHAGENDKIRINKNYSLERGEVNRNIVYSDVIVACPDYMVMQVVSSVNGSEDGDVLQTGQALYTHRVLLREGGTLKGPYISEVSNESGVYTLEPDKSHEPIQLPYEGLYRFERDNANVELYISPMLTQVFTKQAEAEQAEEAAPAQNGAEVSETEQAKPAENPQELSDAPALTAQSLPKIDEACAPCEANEPQQPQLFTEKRMRKNGHIQAQLGLNPRRSKSLSEIVDDCWRHSRIEQLGASLPSETGCSPVASPVDRAKQALREAWLLEEGRSALVKEMLELDGLPSLITGKPPAANEDKSAELDELEAAKLRLLSEIDDLKHERIEKRGELMEETRAAHAQEIARLEAEEKRYKDECAARMRAAESAREAQAEAEKLLTSESRARLDTEFLKYAMFTRAARMLAADENAGRDVCFGVPCTYEPTAAQLISDLRSCLETLGHETSHDEALNLLACLALGEIVLISGATGSGKTFMADALAGALGLNQQGSERYVRLDPSCPDVRKNEALKALLRAEDGLTQRFILLDDINAFPVPDQSRGLLTQADGFKNRGITLIMTCLDDNIGYPLQSRVLDRAFTVRIRRGKRGSWGPAPQLPNACKAPALESVRRAFAGTEVPGVITDRFERLCGKLESAGIFLSPRTRSDMYAYCSAVIPLMTGEPIEALDRAVAQRALPHILATAKLSALERLPEIMCDLPLSVSLLNEPLALPPLE